MKPANLLRAVNGPEGIIVVHNIHNYDLSILGYSSCIEVLSGDCAYMHLTIKKGTSGLIGLSLGTRHDNNDASSFFLEVKWDENNDTPYISLDQQWVPNKLANTDPYGIIVQVGGVIYSNSDNYCNIHKSAKKVEANFICDYLLDKISNEELEVEANKLLEVKAKEEEILKKKDDEIKDLTNRLKRAICDVQTNQELAEGRKEEIDELEARLQNLSSRFVILNSLVDTISSAMEEKKMALAKSLLSALWHSNQIETLIGLQDEIETNKKKYNI